MLISRSMVVFLTFLFIFEAISLSSNDGKLIVATCSPHFSHFSVIFPIAVELSKRLGPNDRIVFGGALPFKDRVNEIENMEFYHLYEGIENHWEEHFVENREDKWSKNKELWPGVNKMIENLKSFVKSVYPEYETTVKRLEHFERINGLPDLIIVDPLAAGGKYYSKKNGIPHVVVSPSVQNPHPYAFGYPSYLGISRVEDMTFSRFLLENIYWNILFIVKSFRMLIDPSGVFRSYIDKSSPVITASLIGFDHPTTDTLSHISKYVGFVPYRRTEPSLPQDLLDFLESNKNVVYVSSGTSIIWPEKAIEGVYRTLEKLGIPVVASVSSKAKVFFDEKKKFFDQSSYGNNIKFVEWVNQYQLLNHSSVKLFVTHGGAGGLAEAIDTETPVIVIPIASDQFGNSVRCEERGIGERLSRISDFEDGTFERKLKMLYDNATSENGKYRKNLRLLNKVSKLHGGVSAAADFLEEILVMDGYSHLETFKNPHRGKILGLGVVFFLFLAFLMCVCGARCSNVKKKKFEKKKKE